MRTATASVREVQDRAGGNPVVGRFEAEWGCGRPDLARHLADAGGAASVSMIAALVKVELRARFDLGERPGVAEYLDRFPSLAAADERVLSLIYEEFCLLEERDERPETEEFCARYEPWKDSLESQLRYHRVLIKAVDSATAPVWFPTPGERFGQFLIGDELGRGQAGRVYLARDETLGGREVALKVSQDRGSEPSTMGRLNHAHIVPVHTVVFLERDGTKLRGLCMPYRPGLPLDEVIRVAAPASSPARAQVLIDAVRAATPGGLLASGPGWKTFPTRGTYAQGVAWVVAALAEALAHAHAQGIFHRDVKPANVLLTAADGPQLLDFNLSHDPHSAVEAEAALRGGTLPYMAPEQLAAFLDPGLWGKVVNTADLYSLGLLLREMLTGRPPEAPDPSLPLARSIRGLLDQRAEFRPDLRRDNPRVPHALEAIAGRCLAHAPADRYPDAGALADDLRRFLARQSLKSAPNPSWRERAVNRVIRNRRPIAVAVVLTAVLMAGFSIRARSPWGRPTFAQAVHELDEARAPSALEILRQLSPDEQATPVVTYYTAAAQARAGHARLADEVLERASLSPGFWSELAAWGRSHPRFSRHAELLATVLLAAALRAEPARKPAMLGRAELALRFALGLDPSRYRAMDGLAVLEEDRAHYASAHDTLTAEIASLDRAGAIDRWQHMARAILTRARVSTHWANSLSVTDPATEHHLSDAFERLDRCAQFLPPNRSDLRFHRTCIRCETILTLAKVAEALGQFERAIDLYGQAGQWLDTLADHPPELDSVYRVLETKVRDRLRTEVPRLKGLLENRTRRDLHSP